MCVRCEIFSSQCVSNSVVCYKSRPLATTSKLGGAEVPEVFLRRNVEFASSVDDDDDYDNVNNDFDDDQSQVELKFPNCFSVTMQSRNDSSQF